MCFQQVDFHYWKFYVTLTTKCFLKCKEKHLSIVDLMLPPFWVGQHSLLSWSQKQCYLMLKPGTHSEYFHCWLYIEHGAGRDCSSNRRLEVRLSCVAGRLKTWGFSSTPPAYNSSLLKHSTNESQIAVVLMAYRFSFKFVKQTAECHHSL